MNNLIQIEKAKVVKVGQFASGNGNNGPWAVCPVKVEWEYPYQQQQQTAGAVPGAPAPELRMGKMTAVVMFRQELATWARDNVKAGNPFENVPDMYLNLWVRLWGDFEAIRRQDGGTWERDTNRVTAEGVEIWHTNA